MVLKKEGQRFEVESPKGLRTLSREQITLAPPPQDEDRAWARAEASRTNAEQAPRELEGPEYVLERFVAHMRLGDGTRMRLVRLFGYSPREDSWKKSTSLPSEAVLPHWKYCKRKEVVIRDHSPSGVYLCNTRRDKVTISRELAGQEKKRGEKYAKAQGASCKIPHGSPCGTPSSTDWVPQPRPPPRPSLSR